MLSLIWSLRHMFSNYVDKYTLVDTKICLFLSSSLSWADRALVYKSGAENPRDCVTADRISEY